jgi:hypothetical protein
MLFDASSIGSFSVSPPPASKEDQGLRDLSNTGHEDDDKVIAADENDPTSYNGNEITGNSNLRLGKTPPGIIFDHFLRIVCFVRKIVINPLSS